jgi:hypothetical protein
MENQEPIKIIITPENKSEFLDITIIVRTCINMGKSIPTSIIARLYEIMYDEKNYNINKLLHEAEKYSAIAVDKIKSMKDYQFTWKDRQMPGSDVLFTPDLKQIFTELIRAFLLYKEKYVTAGRDEAIAFIYLAFDEEYKARMQLNDQRNFTPYKQAVVSGILAMAMDYKLSSKPDLSNEEIFQATRNAISKYKKKKDLFL